MLDFELLLRSVPALLLVLEPRPGFTILEASDAFLRSRRLAREAVVGLSFAEAFPERAEVVRPALERMLASRVADNYSLPVLAPDGRMRYILHRIEAPELELLKSVRERDEALRELERVKEDVGAFAYSASHDLRAPLRAIGGYCAMLRSVQSSGLGPQALDFLGRIESNARQMTAIVDGLLELSRVERAPIVRRPVDITALARRVARELRLREPERAVTVHIDEGLQASADERLVLVVLQNVVGNAWKYTVRAREPRIEVGRRKVAGRDVFQVRDNGIGFEMAAAERIFAPFVRLHPASEFEGHGIGLATVRRVIERHGGQVWAEARPGQGATFLFTFGSDSPLPRAPGPDAGIWLPSASDRA